jgi:hypothetical protein
MKTKDPRELYEKPPYSDKQHCRSYSLCVDQSSHRELYSLLASQPSTENMARQKQQAAAEGNVKKAAAAAKQKKTISHLPKKTRTALGKEGAKAAQKKRGGRLWRTFFLQAQQIRPETG